MDAIKRVALTGATGFVGSALHPVLESGGYEVRCLTRNPEAARARHPGRTWIGADVARKDEVERALEGCDAAFYLVHGMGENDPDFRKRELQAAQGFAAAAAAAGVGRIVYLGGVAPRRRASEHLASRMEVGEALRAGVVPALELRASMIIGNGSLSWLIVRDLAARLPAMVLPRWLRSRTEPVAIEDVVIALERSLRIPLRLSAWYDIPGPDVLNGKQILAITARLLGVRHRIVVEVPVLTPWLSSHWVRLVTRADWSVAKQVVLGLTEDLLALDAKYWEMIDHPNRLSFREAAQRTLATEDESGPVSGPWGAVERLAKAI